jgi:putative tryptophan/tyrosine transport system substrate-binding protein
MLRKIVLLVLSTVILSDCFRAEAQQPAKVPRLGYVSGTGDASNPGPYVEALRQGLRDLGHIDGKNIVIEFRGAAGKAERVPEVVNELVKLNVDVLVLPLGTAIRAARQATKTIPIVMVFGGDPVADGIIESFARPGGQITGVTTFSRDLGGKRFELLTEVVQRLTRVGVLRNPDERTATREVFNEYKNAARAANIQLQSLEVRGPAFNIDEAFQTAARLRVGALITVTSAPLFLQRARIAEVAIKNRLPSMYQGSAWVESGGLMSYSTDELMAFRRAATYVDKIVKGAKPADLPIEQPTKFELVINLKTAKQIGLTIPPNVLARADKVIR